MSIMIKTVFGRSKYKPNTFIGGMAASLYTPQLVATALGISVSRIKVFSVIGSDIQFAVSGGSYVASCVFYGTNLTYFKDNEGLITSLNGLYPFRNTQATEILLPNLLTITSHHSLSENSKLVRLFAPKLKTASHSVMYSCPLLTDIDLSSIETLGGGTGDFSSDTSLVTLNLPKLISAQYQLCLGNTKLKFFTSSVQRFNNVQNFMNCTSIELIDIPKCVQLGSSPAVNANNFINIKLGCVINVNVFLQTCNAGTPDADLQYAITSRGAIVNYII